MQKLSKNASSGILRSIISLIKVGNSIPSAMEILVQIEKGKIKKALEKTLKYIVEDDVSVGLAFKKEDIISESEVFVIDNSRSATEAIESILSIRELGGNFEKTFLKLFAFPLLAVIIGMTIVYFMQPRFHDMVVSLANQVHILKGIDVTEESRLMWYLEDREFVLFLIQIYIVSLIVIVIWYVYTLENNPKVIYKMFNLKTYDEVPFILMLMHNLQKAGLDQVRIFQILRDTSPRKGWVKLFDLLEKQAQKGDYIFTVFEQYHFPRDIILVLKASEVSKTFWDNMGLLVTYIKETNTNKHKFIDKTFGAYSNILGFAVILYFVSGLFMAMFSLQSLAMAMM